MRKRNYNLKLTGIAAAMASLGTVFSLPAFALEVVSQGDLTVTVDTTLSAGASFRASDVNYENVGPVNAAAAGEDDSHLHGTGVQDNSTLRWKKNKAFSEVVKGTIDTQIEYLDYGAFIRGRFFYDDAIVKGNGGTDLPAFYPTDADGTPTEPAQKEGRGAEFLDAFVYGNWNVSEMPLNVRLGQQVVNWGEGVLFANGINTINPIDVNALLSPGAEVKEALIPVKMLYASLGLSDSLSAEAFYQFAWEPTKAPDCGTFFNTIDLVGENCYGGFFALGGEFNNPGSDALRLPRGENFEPDDGGEFGFAARYYVESISTELGAYYIQYHSRLPIISGITPSADNRGSIGARLTNSTYNIQYPEDIKLLGFSFNTSKDLGLPGGESAIAGEISYRQDQPFQIEDSVILTGLVGLDSQLCADNNFDCDLQYPGQQFVDGAIRDDFYQAELSFIHFFDQLLAADRWSVLINMAYNYANIPDKGDLLMNSAYNADLRPAWSPIPEALAGALGGTLEDDYYPTKSSYGYKLRLSGEYSNVFAGVNLVPTISFSHDLKGVTPGPVANFLEDRKALGLSLEANYLNMYKVDVGYTDFFGAEPYNQLNDRDFYSISASVSF